MSDSRVSSQYREVRTQSRDSTPTFETGVIRTDSMSYQSLQGNSVPSTSNPSNKKTGDDKMNSSIESRKSSISSTQGQLSDALRQISQLPSFSTQQQSTTSPALASSLNADTSLGLSDEEQAALRYANHVFARHISLLKEYNDIKDVAMGMLSILAEKKGCRLAEVMEEYGVNEDD
ncbi:hypothetical protein LTS15_004000 [Exophiala xenobiotica]|nr:hypothetical protein LTS15_004000 [Exophiala xenobiotica]